MKGKLKDSYQILKIFFSLFMIIVIIFFENARGMRLYKLVLYFAFYILVGWLRKKKFNKNKRLISWSFLLDIFFIYCMEQNSKYLINYLFHPFYVMVMMESAFLLDWNGFRIGILSAATSSVKFFKWIYYKRDFTNISESLFHFLLMAFLLSIISFARYYQRERQRQEELYQELLHVHQKVKDYAERVEGLSKAEERNRIAREIHDTLGHQMTALIMQLEMCQQALVDDIKKARQLLEQAGTTAREGLSQIREVVETLTPKNSKIKSLRSIEEMVENLMKRTNINIHLDIDVQSELPSQYRGALYRCVQEALTNSLRHGRPDQIWIEIKEENKYVLFIIKDNGTGAKEVKVGFGLRGMMEAMDMVNGEISFNAQEGFVVTGKIPVNKGVYNYD